MAEPSHSPPVGVIHGYINIDRAVESLVLWATVMGTMTGLFGFGLGILLEANALQTHDRRLPFLAGWLGSAVIVAVIAGVRCRRELRNIRQGKSEMFNGAAEAVKEIHAIQDEYLRQRFGSSEKE